MQFIKNTSELANYQLFDLKIQEERYLNKLLNDRIFFKQFLISLRTDLSHVQTMNNTNNYERIYQKVV